MSESARCQQAAPDSVELLLRRIAHRAFVGSALSAWASSCAVADQQEMDGLATQSGATRLTQLADASAGGGMTSRRTLHQDGTAISQEKQASFQRPRDADLACGYAIALRASRVERMIRANMTDIRHHASTFVHRLLLLLMMTSGCVDEAGEDVALWQVDGIDASVLDAARTSESAVRDAGAPVARPTRDLTTPQYPPDWPADLPRVVKVTGSGTGCPAGTMAADISRDGTILTLTFSNFEAYKSKRSTTAINDCGVQIRIASTEEFAYKLEGATAKGYAYLDRGLQGRHLFTANYAGVATTRMEARTELSGPFDDNFFLTFAGAEVPTSPCRREFSLNVRNTLTVRSAGDAGVTEGFLSLTTLDSSNGDSHVRIKLGWRRC